MKLGYKQTEVGVIPEDWEVQRLGKVSEITTGRKDVNEGNPAGEYPFFTCSKTNTYSQAFSFDTEAILIAGNGDVGNLHYYKGKFEAYQRTYVVHKFLSHVRFIWHQLDHQLIESLGIGTIGSSIPYIKKENLTGFAFPFPPNSAEQEAIASALSDADALIESLERLIAKKREIKQGAMQELLTGKKRLPGFTGKWEKKTLFELADCKKELFDDGDWIEAEYLAESGIRLIQTGNIGEGQYADKEILKYISPESFSKLGCKEIHPGDIMICRLADPAGRACILPDIGEDRIITSVDVTIFRPPTSIVDRHYLVNVFNTRQWFEAVSERCGGSTRTRIARGALGKMSITIPALIEQTAIATVLSDMDAEIAALEKKLSKARAIKQGMMQELLTGRIRLV